MRVTFNLLTPKKPEHKIVVRVSSSVWASSTGLHTRKNVNHQKRLSSGSSMFEEDLINSDPYAVLTSITNLSDCPDGLYVLEGINLQSDYETGYAEAWDYQLIPYKE